MYWNDEGYLLEKNNFNENSIIIQTFTLNHGKYSGVVYGGTSRKIKKNFQIGNKISLNWRAKSENKIGYFNVELIKPVSPLFFDDKKRSICILAASSILKILLPERQVNKKIFHSFDNFINNLNDKNWARLYILWELSLIKELGFEISIPKNLDLSNSHNNSIEINGKIFKIPKILLNKDLKNDSFFDICEALSFNRNLIIENFLNPNKIKFPLSRNILEKYFN